MPNTTRLTTSATPLPLADGQRSLYGLDYVSIAAGHPLRLEVPPGVVGPQVLILVPGVDSRERLTLRLRCEQAGAQSELTTVTLAFPTVGERLRIPLTVVPPGIITAELVGPSTLHVLWAPTGCEERLAVAPHLLATTPPPTEDAARVAALGMHLASSASWGLWGWMTGCVYDALDVWGEYDPHWHGVLRAHLAHSLINDDLRYETPRSQIADGHGADIEMCLPFAAVARHVPGHGALERLRRFARGHAPDGAIGGATLTAEGNYTTAWPLVRLADHDRDASWRDLAWTNLRLRRDRLWADGALHLRHGPQGLTYRGWSRGIAWYLLGLVRSLTAVPVSARPVDLVEEAGRALAWAAQHQRDDGLWGNFLEEPHLDADTSGSAGIAAMLALAARADVPGGDHGRAQRCWQALATRADATGFPIGVAPNNKAQGGEDLQRQPGRSSLHFGLGLVAQLAAQLGLVPGK